MRRRCWPPRSRLDSRKGGDFQNLDCNKRSLSFNLKRSEGIALFRKLVRTADVVENWRPDVKVRLGLDYDSRRPTVRAKRSTGAPSGSKRKSSWRGS